MANIQPWGNAPQAAPVAGVTSGWFQQNAPPQPTVNGQPVATPQVQPQSPPSVPVAGASSQPPPGGFTSVAQYVDYLAAQPGSTVGNDKNYWIQQISSHIDPSELASLNNGGTLSAGTIGYWNNKVQSTGAGAGGAGGGMAGGLPAGWSVPNQGGPYPLAPVTGPGLGAAFTTPFNVPTGTDDPGFKFAMDQGLQALDRQNAASGKLLSGGAIKDALDYATGKSLQGYSDAYNRAWQQYTGANSIYNQNLNNTYNMLTGQQNVGVNATNTGVNAGNNYGTNATNLVTNQGQANAGAAIGQGNVGSNAVGGVTNNVTQGIALANNQPPTTVGAITRQPTAY